MEHDETAPPGAGARSADPLHGRLLDRRYRIGNRIARGGMASVYDAHDERLDRTVAVKVMHPSLGDGDEDRAFAERFVREARAAARLSHPNVVAVYDQGDDDGVIFLVMELVSGHTLRDTISKESPMAPAKALALLEPVLSALAAAHRSGLIHRDVKPENVLIADDGRIKVADFGLAKAVSSQTRHTATQGVLIGTVSYLAPELVVDGSADARADVYAAGIVLYELLTGHKPHDGESPIQVAYRHVHHDVPPPSRTVPDLPDYVDALVARATARDATFRPADASVLLHQVHRVSQALSEGLREDAELTLDLSPVRAAAATVEQRSDTTPDERPDAWDDLSQILAEPTGAAAAPVSGTEATTTFDRPVEHGVAPAYAPPAHTPAPPPRPETPARTRAPKVPRSPKPPREKRSRRGPVLLVLALIAALAVGGGAFWFGWARYDTTPRVAELTQAEAEAALDEAGLDVAYADAVYDSEVPEGSVVSSDPAGGARVLDGDTVTLTLSLGKLLVPKTKGLTEDEAQDALLDRQLEFGESVGRFSESVPEGVVLRSDPKVRTELEPGATVDLIVSKGKKPLKVGNWVGKEIDAATRVLTKRGLQPRVASEEYSDSVPKGEIIGQDPAGGTLFRGEPVSFVVSLGPELIEVPRVRAFGVSAAEQALEDAGFKVDVQRNREFYAGLGIAVNTDPGAGELAPKGSTITLFIV